MKRQHYVSAFAVGVATTAMAAAGGAAYAVTGSAVSPANTSVPVTGIDHLRDTFTLAPGASRTVSVTADPRFLGDFDPSAGAWTIREGLYEASVGSASDALRARAVAAVAAQNLKP